jgi:hypothetical protein
MAYRLLSIWYNGTQIFFYKIRFLWTRILVKNFKFRRQSFSNCIQNTKFYTKKNL